MQIRIRWPTLRPAAIWAAAATLATFFGRGIIEEFIFSSTTDWLKVNAGAAGDFIVWRWSPLVVGLALFLSVWVIATLLDRNRPTEASEAALIDAEDQPQLPLVQRVTAAELRLRASRLSTAVLRFISDRSRAEPQVLLNKRNWNKSVSEQTKFMTETISLYHERYGADVVSTYEDLKRAGLSDPMADSLYQYPTNPLGIRTVAQAIGALANRLSDDGAAEQSTEVKSTGVPPSAPIDDVSERSMGERAGVEPISLEAQGIRWQHDGFHPASTTPRVKPTCPTHKVPVFFFDALGVAGISGSFREPRDTDLLGLMGSLTGIANGHHSIDVPIAKGALSVSYFQLRQVAEGLMKEKLRKRR